MYYKNCLMRVGTFSALITEGIILCNHWFRTTQSLKQRSDHLSHEHAIQNEMQPCKIKLERIDTKISSLQRVFVPLNLSEESRSLNILQLKYRRRQRRHQNASAASYKLCTRFGNSPSSARPAVFFCQLIVVFFLYNTLLITE